MEEHKHAGEDCCQGCCDGHKHMFRHCLLRWLLGALVITVVFFVGVKVGEFKENFWNNGFDGYGYNRVMRGRNMMYFNDGARFFNSSSTPYMMRWGR